MKDSKFLIYGNGKDKPPTGFMFEKEQIKGLYFNQSPTKVFSDLLYIIALQRFFVFFLNCFCYHFLNYLKQL